MTSLSSFGTLLKVGDGGTSENFTTIAKVRDIDGPELSSDTEDTTNHSSPDGINEFIVTILDVGEVTFEVDFLPSDATHNGATGLIRDWRNRIKRNFQMVFPDAGNTTWAFSAYVTRFKPKVAVKGVLRADVRLKLSGAFPTP